jgi:hypothetical protein
MQRIIARLLMVTVVVVASLGSSATPVAADPPFPVDFTRPSLAELQAHLRANGLGFAADRLLHRAQPIPGPAGVRWTVQPITSSNWGGYFNDLRGTGGLQVREVRGWYNASQVFATPPVGSWSGVGGRFGSQVLWQSGVDQYLMKMFIELVPDPRGPQYFDAVVNNGDLIFSNQYDNLNGTWTASIQDLTTGAFASGLLSGAPDQNSADWITEALGSPVPSFNPVNFQGFWIYEGSSFDQNIDSPAWVTWKSTMNLSPYCITPSALGGDLRSFTASFTYPC